MFNTLRFYSTKIFPVSGKVTFLIFFFFFMSTKSVERAGVCRTGRKTGSQNNLGFLGKAGNFKSNKWAPSSSPVSSSYNSSMVVTKLQNLTFMLITWHTLLVQLGLWYLVWEWRFTDFYFKTRHIWFFWRKCMSAKSCCCCWSHCHFIT